MADVFPIECSTRETSADRRETPEGIDLSGTDAGPYRLIYYAGRRGLADLYFGRQRSEDNAALIAIKVVDTLTAPARTVQLFNNERQLVGKFQHPHLARMIDEGTTSTGALYLAMEQVDGSSLEEFVKRWAVGATPCIEMILQVCSAVEYLHSEGFSHHDLRSESIVVTHASYVTIADFSHTMPIPPFPEERCLARAADVYSLGVLLRDTVNGAAWPELQQIVAKATRSAPCERFRSVSEFAQRLQRLL
jgi:serine/threonine protein kinase